MQLTKASEYAVRCARFLSMQNAGATASRNEIVDAVDIPRDFLTKIGQLLSRYNILEIIQGPKGGFRFMAPADKLNLLDVIEAMMGEIFFSTHERYAWTLAATKFEFNMESGIWIGGVA